MYTDIIDNIFNDLIDYTYINNKKRLEKNNNRPDDDFYVNIIKSLSSYENNDLTDKKYTKEVILSIVKSLEQYVLAYSLLWFKNIKDFNNFVLSYNKSASFNSMVFDVKHIIDQLMFINLNIKKIKDPDNKKQIIPDKRSLDIYDELNESLTSNLKSPEIFHSVCKYLLYNYYFLKNDKGDVFNILEEFELSTLESKYIEILESTTSDINYDMLEKVLSDRFSQSFIDDMYQLLLNVDEEQDLTIEQKLSYLFKRKILIPITDDFLRYNKSSESYDQNTTIDENIRTNKKNNTKIKYIINKMNDAIDYYKTKNDKVFYQPLIYRHAVLVNNLEEVDILKKLLLVHNKTDEQISQYEELNTLRRYPYQNFRDFKSYGFNFESDFTVRSIRSPILEYKNIDKFDFIKNQRIDWRIINKNNSGNIVGIAIPNKIPDSVDMVTDEVTGILTDIPVTSFDKKIHSLIPLDSAKKGTINTVLHMLKKMILLNSDNKNIYCWLFDKKQDIHKKFSEIETFPQDEYYKIIISYFYDEIINITYDRIMNVLSNSTFTSPYFLLHEAYNIEKTLLPLSQTFRNNLNYYVYNEKIPSPKPDELFDMSENYINKNLIPLLNTNIELIPKKSIVKISIDDLNNRSLEYLSEEHSNATCQHFITWDRIKQLRSSYPNKFNDKLNSYIKEFVIANSDNDFICKSCSETVPIKKYLSHWASDTEEGITITLSLQTTLENVAEYEKYSVAIKNMSKILEKIASSIGLSYMIGAKITSDLKRQELIKALIDLITSQFSKLRENSAEERIKRLNDSQKKYGISPSLTQFFLFELKNELFSFSSKDVDKFKIPKVNNIMAYMIILLLNEMNESVIKGFPNDKIINYYMFDKIGYNLFDGLFIRINNANDIVNVKEYKLLCYVIFILSGFVVKYNMWLNAVSNTKKSFINAQDQKSAIHTTIDLLNNVLDTGSQSNKIYIYENFTKKFFQNLKNVYSGMSANSTLTYLKESINKKIVMGSNGKLMFKGNNTPDIILKPYFEADDFGDKKYPVLAPFIPLEKYETLPLSFSYNEEKLYEYYKGKQTKVKKLVIIPPKKSDKKYKIGTNSQIVFYDYIESTIKKWEQIIGQDSKIDNNNLFLRKMVYVIDHDYRGNKLDDPIFILDGDKSLVFKKQDQHFNINVYFYYLKENDIYMFYNAHTFDYVGYKSGNTYNTLLNTGCNLSPKQSIKHKLLFLGHSNMFYPLTKDLKDVVNSNNDTEKLLLFVSNIIRNRIIQLKNILINVQRIFNQMMSQNKNTLEKISKHFSKKIKNIKTMNDDGTFKFFANINEIINSSYFESNISKEEKITFDKDYLYAGNIIKLFNTDQKLIIYMCEQFNKMLDINENDHNKIMLVYMFSMIIDQQYDLVTAREKNNNYADIKKFNSLESNFYNKVDVVEMDIFEGLSDEERKELENEIKYDVEANDALDVDLEDDDEDGGNSQIAHSFGEE